MAEDAFDIPRCDGLLFSRIKIKYEPDAKRIVGKET